jgi:hypothetical protein
MNSGSTVPTAVPTGNPNGTQKRELLAQSTIYDDPFEEEVNNDYYFNATSGDGGAFSLTFETEQGNQEAECTEYYDDGYGAGATCSDIEFEDHEDYATYQEWIWSEDNIKPDEWGSTDQVDRYRAWRRALSPVSADPGAETTESDPEAGAIVEATSDNGDGEDGPPADAAANLNDTQDDNSSVPGLGSMTDSSDYFSDWSTDYSSDDTVVKTRSVATNATVTVGPTPIVWPTYTWDITGAFLHNSLMARPTIEFGTSPASAGATTGASSSTEGGAGSSAATAGAMPMEY